MNTQQLPPPELIEQIIEPPYEPIEDITALAHLQVTSTVSVTQAMISATALTALMTMMAKAMKIALG